MPKGVLRVGAKNVECSPLLLLSQIYPYENRQKIQQILKIEEDKKKKKEKEKEKNRYICSS